MIFTDFLIRKGTVEDTELFISLVNEVRDRMINQEWFYLDPPELIREFMQSGIMQLWLAMDHDRTAAVFSTITPGLRKDNYGYDLGFTKEELLQVVNMDTAAVHPDYRGHGLQAKLVSIAEKELGKEGKRILLCTVHPDNRYSLQNVLRLGYSIQMKLEKYGSIRYVLRKDI